MGLFFLFFFLFLGLGFLLKLFFLFCVRSFVCMSVKILISPSDVITSDVITSDVIISDVMLGRQLHV